MTTGLAEAARAVKEAKRAANRAAWARDPRNANFQREQMLETVVVPEVIPKPAPVDTSSLGRLRAIMADTGAPLHRRLDSAEVILTYELAPGALAAAPPEQEVAAVSYRFMQACVDADSTPEPLRFRALRSIAAIENARASRVDTEQMAMKRQLLHRLGMPADSCPDFQWPPSGIAEKLDRPTKQRRASR